MTVRLPKKSALVAGGLLVFALFCCWIADEARKEFEPYQYALARAKADARVQAALGEPIREAWFSAWRGETTGGEGGHANLSIPISGPKGSAAILVVAARAGGRWHYSTINVTVAGQAGVIDLLAQK